MLSHAYNIVNDSFVVALGHGKDVVDFLNDIEKRIIKMLTTTLQLPGAAINDSHMVMHTSKSNTDISLLR